MKALTFQEVRSIACESIPDPKIESPADVIVRVSLTAVCGSDLHVYRGRDKGQTPGTVMGHEFVGTILETGEGVRGFKAGDRVMSPFTTSCGECFFCRAGLTCRCERGQLFGWRKGGKGLHGGQAELVRVPLADSTLMHIPNDVSDEEGLLLCDIFPTGYFCAEMAGVGSSGVYALFGCGPVGLLALMSARELGAKRILAYDPIDYRLAFAASIGAEPIDTTGGDPADAIRRAADGRGVDAAMDAVGSEESMRMAFESIRPGGTMAVIGVQGEYPFPAPMAETYNKNLTYRVGRCPARHYMERLLPLVRERRLPITSIITHRMPLEEGVEAYRIFDEKFDRCIKIVLVP
jgi:threonine dehydrogenase-like Zn-dependent dehydrogenase